MKLFHIQQNERSESQQRQIIELKEETSPLDLLLKLKPTRVKLYSVTPLQLPCLVSLRKMAQQERAENIDQGRSPPNQTEPLHRQPELVLKQDATRSQ